MFWKGTGIQMKKSINHIIRSYASTQQKSNWNERLQLVSHAAAIVSSLSIVIALLEFKVSENTRRINNFMNLMDSYNTPEMKDSMTDIINFCKSNPEFNLNYAREIVQKRRKGEILSEDEKELYEKLLQLQKSVWIPLFFWKKFRLLEKKKLVDDEMANSFPAGPFIQDFLEYVQKVDYIQYMVFTAESLDCKWNKPQEYDFMENYLISKIAKTK